MFVKIKVSIRSARLPFHSCGEKFILEVCHGCCVSANKESAWVYVGDSEIKRIESLGGAINNNLMVGIPGEKNKSQCPFLDESTGFCAYHDDRQPLGCRVSPFRISNLGVLLIRKRNLALKCFKDKTWQGGVKLPAYLGHSRALIALFGKVEYARLKAYIEGHVLTDDFLDTPFYLDLSYALLYETIKGNLVRRREQDRRDSPNGIESKLLDVTCKQLCDSIVQERGDLVEVKHRKIF